MHVGIGPSGYELRDAVLVGASKAVGVDCDQGALELAEFVARGKTDAIARILRRDSLVTDLYQTGTIDQVMELLDRSDAEFLPLADSADMNFYCADVLEDDLGRVTEGIPVDVLIGNMMAHQLIQRKPWQSSLDCLAAALRPGGIAVFSLPFHLTDVDDPDDEDMRGICLYDSPIYQDFRSVLLASLRGDSLVSPGASVPNFRFISPMALRTAEARNVGNTFTYVASHTELSAPSGVDPRNILRFLGLVEACLLAWKTPTQVIGSVTSAIRAIEGHGEIPALHTYLRYHVFRRL